jgi:hypothetical protein
MPQSATSIDSFRDTLNKVLMAFKPSTVYEWGPGNSTDIISSFPSVTKVTSIEDSLNWYEAYLKRKPNHVKLEHRPTDENYSLVDGVYDLFFVDGKDRVGCIKEARKHISANGVIILHDAERPMYEETIRSFKHYYFTDNWNTCVMTDSDKANKILNGVI